MGAVAIRFLMGVAAPAERIAGSGFCLLRFSADWVPGERFPFVTLDRMPSGEGNATPDDIRSLVGNRDGIVALVGHRPSLREFGRLLQTIAVARERTGNVRRAHAG